MRGPSALLRLWPGGTLLWREGAWLGLMLAVGFAVLLDLALLTTWIWTDVVSSAVRDAAWVMIGAIWLAWLVASARSPAADGLDPEPLFQQAITEYLKGDWLAAQRLLERLLKYNAHDAEARLTLATLLRRTGRLDDAARQLDQLARQDAALKWAQEIIREQSLITRQRREDEHSANSAVWSNREDSVKPAKAEPGPQAPLRTAA